MTLALVGSRDGDSAPVALCPDETPPAELPSPGASTGQTWSCWREPRRGTRMIRGMEQLCWEERLGELALFSLEKERLQSDLNVALQYLKGACKKDEEKQFPRAWSAKTRGNDFKLRENMFRQDIRKNFVPCEVGEALAQGAQRSCGCPWIPGSAQGQVGQGLEQPGIVEGIPAHGRGVLG
ncbi:hypothetical protein HGM15179_007507 [Zosterops borbonicus]|uniref:Uncharacterized protein n=1 Tax=Zosterops borbonicus TaxID=364589 RepID=A0A8K1LMP9_9PASS|nr:hypothetical protein HGM15179_007507 [Zosterops borbonicus]